MNPAVACDEFLPIDRMGVAAEIGDSSSGFPHDHRSGGHVPGAEFDLPKSIEAARRDITKIQSCATGAPHALCLEREAREVLKVVVGRVADVIGKAGDCEGRLKLRSVRNGN